MSVRGPWFASRFVNWLRRVAATVDVLRDREAMDDLNHGHDEGRSRRAAR